MLKEMYFWKNRFGKSRERESCGREFLTNFRFIVKHFNEMGTILLILNFTQADVWHLCSMRFVYILHG